MGIKSFWKKSLGDFRDEDRKLIASLSDKKVAIDTSAWVHTLDGAWDVQYARTSSPKYPHPAIINTFSARHRVLTVLRIHPIFVLDGKSPSVKKKTNRERQEKSLTNSQQYKSKLDQIKAGPLQITDEVRKDLLKNRRGKARPIAEEYATLSQWMDDHGIEYVQAPFEADAQIKRIVDEGRATAAITEDGDLVVYGVPHILSLTKMDTLEPNKSTCQYFDLQELKGGKYQSPIAVGRRADYLAEISCLSGNDYINNLPLVGPAIIFGTHKGKGNDQAALIDAFVSDTKVNSTMTERQWLEGYVEQRSKKNATNVIRSAPEPEDWSPEKFIKVRNLIKHYPVFAKDGLTGQVSLMPLNPLPSNISIDEWGTYIGFDKHPSEYFDHDYEEYYDMTIVASKDKPRNQLLGPRYTSNDNSLVDTGKLLPLFARVDFDQEPVNVQPTRVLRAYLLARGVTVPQNTSADKIRELAQRAHEAKSRRPVLDPELVPKEAKWVGFEPLDEVEIGDDYDNWNRDYVTKIRALRPVDDNYIDQHFGTERAQHCRETALDLLNGGNVGLSTVLVRNVKSKMRPDQELIAINFKCLSKERSITHSVYMVFENKKGGDYVPSPASYCSCEAGAFFDSHMLCFLYVMRGIQTRWREKTQEEIERLMPEDRRIVSGEPCLIENILAANNMKRQRAQSNRQLKRNKSK